jgi:hypothetical protein
MTPGILQLVVFLVGGVGSGLRTVGIRPPLLLTRPDHRLSVQSLLSASGRSGVHRSVNHCSNMTSAAIRRGSFIGFGAPKAQEISSLI